MTMTRIGQPSKRIVLLVSICFVCATASYLLWKQGKIEEPPNEGRYRHENEGSKCTCFALGRFWVLSDSHVDILYRTDGDPATRCRNVSSKKSSGIVRKFGHSNCDAPIELLTSAFTAASRIDPNVDFLIWLGYSGRLDLRGSHLFHLFSDATSHLAWQQDTILPVNAHFSEQLRKYFPTTLVIPVLGRFKSGFSSERNEQNLLICVGNHDILLQANHTTRFQEFYNRTQYHRLLKDAEAQRTFIQGNLQQARTGRSNSEPILLVCRSLLGGYYFLRYQPIKRQDQTYLRFVVLNTAMFQPQHITSFDPDEAQRQIEYVHNARKCQMTRRQTLGNILCLSENRKRSK